MSTPLTHLIEKPRLPIGLWSNDLGWKNAMSLKLISMSSKIVKNNNWIAFLLQIGQQLDNYFKFHC